MLIDEVIITVQAGNGGNGKVHFRRDALTAKGGPDGGNGGRGGSVYVQGSDNIFDLQQFRYTKVVKAQHGEDGKGKNQYGKDAKDVTLKLPLGTMITDTETGTQLEIRNSTKVLFLVRGGKGGRGNTEFATPTNRTPMQSEKGAPGETGIFHLELKRIADIGLIGLPNAGKSSVLSVLTHATPKIGDYPFTTLEPNIGMMDSHPIADIPGLIEGASEGKGLGFTFLKHIEKTKILVHCIDASSDDVKKAYMTVRQELEAFNGDLVKKPEIIALLKSDLISEQQLSAYKKLFTEDGHTVVSCSLYDDEQINLLKQSLLLFLEKHAQ
jgi:GTPase